MIKQHQSLSIYRKGTTRINSRVNSKILKQFKILEKWLHTQFKSTFISPLVKHSIGLKIFFIKTLQNCTLIKMESSMDHLISRLPEVINFFMILKKIANNWNRSYFFALLENKYMHKLFIHYSTNAWVNNLFKNFKWMSVHRYME